MSRVLISIERLAKLDHQTSELLDLIDALLKQGWSVDVNTARILKNAAPALLALQAQPMITLVTDKAGALAETYDVIWIYNGFFSQKLIEKIADSQLVSRIVFRHFFDYADVYIPYGPALENRIAVASLSLSASTTSKLNETGVTQEKMIDFPWTLGDAFAAPDVQVNREGIKNILYVSGELSTEMQEVQQFLEDRGLIVDWLDQHSLSERLTPAFFQQYDVVIASESFVPMAIASSVPVFLSAGGYVEGYLTQSNFTENQNFHFSCANSLARFKPEEWYELLLQGYNNARQWVDSQSHRLRQQWLLSLRLPALLEALPEADMISLSDKEITDLTLHAKTLVADKVKDYSIQQWLKDRKISEARTQALKAFIGSVPGSNDIGVVIVGDDASELHASIDSVLVQSEAAKSVTVLTANRDFSHAGVKIRFCAAAWTHEFNTLVTQSAHQKLMFLPAGIRLLEDALILLAEQQIRHPQQKIWYADEMKIDEYDEHEVLLRPACNVDLVRSFPYMGSVMLFQREFLADIGGFDTSLTLLPGYDALFRCMEHFGPTAIGRVAEVIYSTPSPTIDWLNNKAIQAEHVLVVNAHLRRMNLDAVAEETESSFVKRVRYRWAAQPLVSIIIPTRDHYALLKNCIETLMEKTAWTRYELIIVDNDSICHDTQRFVMQLENLKLSNIKVLLYPGSFNFSAINNFAAQYAQGEVLLFLNNDITITHPDWLDAMLEQALRPEVGMVGARLEYKDGRVQHAGYTVGVKFGVEPSFGPEGANESGYLHYLKATHNVTAVSASCMMIRKEVFIAANGFSEEEFPIYFGDVDLGLKLQQQGYLNVWTPYARVEHMGGASRLMHEKFNVPARPDLGVLSALRAKWGAALHSDTAYHPSLHKMGKLFTLSEGTARFREALPGRPLPVVLANHVNWYGCGNHRVIQPFKAMEENLLLEGGMSLGTSGVMEVAQLQPDIILMELITGNGFPSIIEQYRQVCDAKIVVEYDDYLLNLPIKNGNRAHFPQSIVKNFRRVLETADWVVVSTHALKQAYSEYHPDIRVAQNRLATRQWGHLFSARGTGNKIRVGWAGGGTHAGDLEILRPIIKALEDKVEWVFMGMKPDNVKCEFHPGVPFEMYPEKLSSLNLDLALVPLEINQFNECKSNLRLLEIGTCGVPIIATNIEPYRCGLPVTLVDNRFKDWMNAIMTYINDETLRVTEGDALREQIHRDWYLRDEGLNEWRHGWLSEVK
ncbi:glycosyltransferase [Leclercia tamurae]|uniref:Glycosyltransferase n=1 Tax=Leclercia tamurae TaxID=2926467 RepID=A0ABT2RER7_9ENTR|nr:glycosyltransferase [Leclercia tamurae]MCU6679352.1 glycosyltransferase [Leclercia tamurae]